MAPRIRQSRIMRVLKERHSGRLDANSDSNVTAKLLSSMHLGQRDYSRLLECLDKMHEGGTLVVQWDQDVITSISIPELATAEVIDESEGIEVPAPKGLKASQVRRTSNDGKVSPVEVGYTSPEAEEVANGATKEVADAGEIVLEQLVAVPQDVMTREEVGLFVLAALNGLYDSDAPLQALTWRVVNWLVVNGYLTKLAGKNTSYRLVKPDEPEKDYNKLVLKLLDALETAEVTEARLNQENTELRTAAARQISQEKLTELLDGLERAQDTEKRLNEEIRKLKIEQIRSAQAHEEALATLRGKLEAADTRNQELQRQLNKKSAGIDEATKERARRLGFDI